MKALIIYSTYSGRTGIEKKIKYIEARLKEKYTEIILFQSTYKGSMYDYISKNGEMYQLVVAAGGDGTVHEIINATMTLMIKPVLAYIPAGTINDSARTLGLGKNLKRTMDKILSGATAHIDIFKINDSYFTYGLAAGSLTEISYDAPHKIKKNIGRFAYYLQALKAIRKTRHISITLEANGERIESTFSLFLALNTRYLAGFKIHRKNRIYLNDGTIRITLIKRKNKLLDLIDFANFLLFGEGYKHNIRHITTNSFSITSKEAIAYNTDGEMFDRVNSVHVDTVPHAIEIILSKRVCKRHFLNEETNKDS